MNLKIWFIAVFFAACVGFSYQDDLANSEDVPMEDIAAELEEAESDLEDPSSRKVPRRHCRKGFVRKCFYFKHCYKRHRFCVCVKRYYGDETKHDNQVNDEVTEYEAKEIEETNVADPSKTKRPRKCPRYLRRKCVVVKVGYKKRIFCFCVRRCYGDETVNDNELSDEIPEDKIDDLQENSPEEQEDTDLEDPSSRKGRPRVCPKNRRRKCFYFKHCYRRRRFCVCVKRYYGDETEHDNQVNDEVAEDEAEELDEETSLEDPSKGRCRYHLRRKCFVTKKGKRRRRYCVCLRPCHYGDETSNDNQGA